MIRPAVGGALQGFDSQGTCASLRGGARGTNIKGTGSLNNV